MSRIRFDDAAVKSELQAMQRRAERVGVDALAEKIADRLQQNTARAFSAKVDPGTGRSWDPAAETTQKSRLFNSLLHRTGALESAVRKSVAKGATGSAFARIAIDTGASSPTNASALCVCVPQPPF